MGMAGETVCMSVCVCVVCACDCVQAYRITHKINIVNQCMHITSMLS